MNLKSLRRVRTTPRKVVRGKKYVMKDRANAENCKASYDHKDEKCMTRKVSLDDRSIVNISKHNGGIGKYRARFGSTFSPSVCVAINPKARAQHGSPRSAENAAILLGCACFWWKSSMIYLSRSLDDIPDRPNENKVVGHCNPLRELLSFENGRTIHEGLGISRSLEKRRLGRIFRIKREYFNMRNA